jgi:hypothetical protein
MRTTRPAPVSVFHVSELTDLPAIYAAFSNHGFWAAVAHHYDLPTGLLDVTTDPRHVIPLSTLFFDGDTRPRRQQAALLSGIFYAPPDHEMERLRQVVPRGAMLPRPARNTFAELVIARIVVEKAFRSPAVKQPTQCLFPCPYEDKLYARFLEKCDWVETFAHCDGVRQHPRRRVMIPTGRTRPVESRRELADDPSWFTILFVGDDADAVLAYAWRWIYIGSPMGRVHLFDRAGLNLIVVTAEETKRLVMEPGVAVIVFCDIGNSLIRSGTAAAICRVIARKRRVVVPVYLNLDEAERRISTQPFALLPETAAIEAEKITGLIRSAIELSWQLQRADAGSTCRKLFTKLLAEFSPAANRLYSSTPISQKSENR